MLLLLAINANERRYYGKGGAKNVPVEWNPPDILARLLGNIAALSGIEYNKSPASRT